MAAYLKIAKEQLKGLRWFNIEQVPRTENVEADGLARIASGLEGSTLRDPVRAQYQRVSQPRHAC